MAKLYLRDSKKATGASPWESEECKEKWKKSTENKHHHGHQNYHFMNIYVTMYAICMQLIMHIVF